jgi:calcium-dependent protein kinase
LKPENVMYTKAGEAKLIDFGLAKQTTKKNQSMHTIAGTPYFISPEVLNGNYGKECDIWSLGVILYLMITGCYPFDGDNRTVVFDKIQKGQFTFPRNVIEKSNPDQLDLIKQMIVVDRKKRISAKDALNHPWIKNMLASGEAGAALDMEVIKKLTEFRGESKLKKAALNIFIKMLQPKDIESLKKEF